MTGVERILSGNDPPACPSAPLDVAVQAMERVCPVRSTGARRWKAASSSQRLGRRSTGRKRRRAEPLLSMVTSETPRTRGMYGPRGGVTRPDQPRRGDSRGVPYSRGREGNSSILGSSSSRAVTGPGMYSSTSTCGKLRSLGLLTAA